MLLIYIFLLFFFSFPGHLRPEIMGCCNKQQEIEQLNWDEFDPISDKEGVFQIKLSCIKDDDRYDNLFFQLQHAFSFPHATSRLYLSNCTWEKDFYFDNYSFIKDQEQKLLKKAQKYMQQLKHSFNFSEQIPSLFFLATIHLPNHHHTNIETNNLKGILLNCGIYMSKFEFNANSIVERSAHYTLEYFLTRSEFPWICIIDSISDETLKINLYTLVPLEDIGMWVEILENNIKDFACQYCCSFIAPIDSHSKKDPRVKNRWKLYSILLSEYLILKFHILYDESVVYKLDSYNFWKNPITFVKNILSPSLDTTQQCILRIGRCWVSIKMPDQGYLTFIENKLSN